MGGAKIQFSIAEAELMNNANIIFTKISVQEKVRLLLAALQERMQDNELLDPIFSTPPKISKGENYLGLPYLVLDYPRYFSGKDTVLIRSMFWWGRHFSSTLLLTGSTKLRFLQNIKEAHTRLAEAHYYIGVHPDPWQHHFEGDNLLPISDCSMEDFEAQCNRLDHIKIAAKWSLHHPESAPDRLLESWYLLLSVLDLVATEPVK